MRSPQNKEHTKAAYKEKMEVVGVTNQLVITEMLRYIDKLLSIDHNGALIICGYDNINGNSQFSWHAVPAIQLLRPISPAAPMKVIFKRTMLAAGHLFSRLGPVRLSEAKLAGKILKITRADASAWRDKPIEVSNNATNIEGDVATIPNCALTAHAGTIAEPIGGHPDQSAKSDSDESLVDSCEENDTSEHEKDNEISLHPETVVAPFTIDCKPKLAKMASALSTEKGGKVGKAPRVIQKRPYLMQIRPKQKAARKTPALKKTAPKPVWKTPATTNKKAAVSMATSPKQVRKTQAATKKRAAV